MTHLIRILTLVFIASTAIAVDDFDATFSIQSVSSLTEHNAVYGKPIIVTLTFGAKVDRTAAATKNKLTILIEDKFGAVTGLSPVSDITRKDLDPFTKDVENDSQTFVFTIGGIKYEKDEHDNRVPVYIQEPPPDTDDVKVHLYITKGVPDLDPFSAKTSKQGRLTIDLVRTGSNAECPFCDPYCHNAPIVGPDEWIYRGCLSCRYHIE